MTETQKQLHEACTALLVEYTGGGDARAALVDLYGNWALENHIMPEEFLLLKGTCELMLLLETIG